MYRFDMNRRYNQTIVPPIQIIHVHSSVSFQRAIYQKYDRRGRESPSGYGVLGFNQWKIIRGDVKISKMWSPILR